MDIPSLVIPAGAQEPPRPAAPAARDDAPARARHAWRWLVLFLAAAAEWASAARGQEPAGLVAAPAADGVWIQDGNIPVLFYQRAPKSVDGAPPRAHYIHPLCDLDGHELTEDAPRDHPHHHGVFWAWHQLLVGDRPIGDPWIVSEFQCDVRQFAIRQAQRSIALDAVVDWTSPLWTSDGSRKPLVEEHTVIRVHPVEGGARRIDFDITLKALEDHLRLGGSTDDKGYGGFSVRVRLPDGVRFLGLAGAVQPRRDAVQAGPAVDIAAEFSPAGTAGVAMLQHPSVPGFPQPWILRHRGSMQNAAYPGREPVALSRDHPWKFRYRLVVHRGACDAERLRGWSEEYGGE